MGVLVVIAGTLELTIAERAGVTKQAIGPIVRELETMSHVRTESDPKDGRAKLASLTPAGRRVIDDAKPLIDQIENTICKHLGAKRFEMVVQLLTSMTGGFRRR